ncbi:MAG TPA: ABC transporter ATP-binding protein [Candidatus Merdiplasma excrementigallinarum]|uniref:ABC transporter ATP-binding protein n=1 Tax=Candidatus Merdiplasma excrementigallinarum TaxID=2840864 RepID=A0A9D1NXP9_9FIRM|nr:ABC transporter ATP-binding protein [Candidatus Merdiplasma excrementigallinarum]
MNRNLLRSVREYKRETFLTPVFVALEVFMEVLIPLLMANIIDVGIAGGNLSYTVKMGLLLVALALIALFFGVKSGQLGAIASAGYAKNLRHDIFYKVQDFSFGNIDHFSSSGLVTRLTTDITNVQMAFMFTIRLLARAPIMIVLSLIMTMTISIPIAIMLLITVPVLGGVLLILAKKAHPHFVQVFDEYDVLNNTVQENVNAARVVKAYVREEHENEKFGKISTIVFDLFTKAEKIVAWNAPIMQFTVYGVVLAMVLIGGKSIIGGSMQTGELTSVIVYAIQILSSLMMVTFVFVQIMIAEASTDRISEVLNEVPEMEDAADAVTEVPNGDIDFEHVNFSYSGEGGNLSLKDVNLHIKSGQVVGIIGGTGSAKSTLVQLIPRLYDVTEGSVKVGGIDVRKYSLKSLRDQVSMVLQKNVLFTGSIYENVRWGDENASDEEVQRVCQLAQADSFIQEFPQKYDTMIVEGGNNVSGGQKQRLCIARALLKKPKILILDDSTSAVDTKTDALIRQAFREEIPDTTRIIIAQRVSSVEDADMIIVMDNGRIDGIGTSEELLKTNAIYREVYESQVKGGTGNESAEESK